MDLRFLPDDLLTITDGKFDFDFVEAGDEDTSHVGTVSLSREKDDARVGGDTAARRAFDFDSASALIGDGRDFVVDEGTSSTCEGCDFLLFVGDGLREKSEMSWDFDNKLAQRADRGDN